MGLERGNALFLILIAVALFAALSYAITNSGRGAGSIDKETAQLGASQMMQYGAELERAIQRMHVINGIPIENLDFRSDKILNNSGANPNISNNSCTDTSCQIFHKDGGNVTFQNFEKYAVLPAPAGWGVTWEKPGHHLPIMAGIVGFGSDKAEIAIRIPAIQTNVCNAINRLLKLDENPSYDLTGENFYSFRLNTTTALDATDTWFFGDDVSDLERQGAFCMHDSGYGHYIHVVAIR